MSVNEGDNNIIDNQVTSDKILQEAFQIKPQALKQPQQTIQDLDELYSYQRQKRKEYEQHLNKNRLNFPQWIRYARWEAEDNHDIIRARSIFERALEVSVHHIPFWTHYVQMELVHKNVNHARNILDRGVTILPRVDKLWFLYVQTEELIKDYFNVRRVFERWLTWRPDLPAWEAYIAFEKRYQEYENVRSIYIRFVDVHPRAEVWLQWINFELKEVPEDIKTIENIRNVFELAVDTILETDKEQSYGRFAEIISNWCTWETSIKEFDRAKSILLVALKEEAIVSRIPFEERYKILRLLIDFEKVYGNESSLTAVMVEGRKLDYERSTARDPRDYNSWWSLIELSIRRDQSLVTRSLFEKAVTTTPKEQYKSSNWQIYTNIWTYYALWEEFKCKELVKAGEVWNRALKTIPHSTFTFASLWIHLAKYELRRDNESGLLRARKVLGRAIGVTSVNKPKHKIFSYYIDLEKTVGDGTRVRKLYEKWIELLFKCGLDSLALEILLAYIEFELSLGEHERCISLYQLGIKITTIPELENKLPAPELIWISFINYYIEEMLYEEARELYRSLIDHKPSAKVWISFALFESSILTTDQLDIFRNSDQEEFEFALNESHKNNTRAVFQEAENFFRLKGHPKDRLAILEAWKDYEAEHGSQENFHAVCKKLPKIIDVPSQVEVDPQHHKVEYHFPDDEKPKPGPTGIQKFLASAQEWMEDQNE